MSIDKVLALAQTIMTLQIKLPLNNQIINKTMLMKRHKRIAPLFDDQFWGYALTKSGKSRPSAAFDVLLRADR